MKARTAKLGELLTLRREKVEVELAESYTEIGVRSFGKGLFIKPPVTGADLGDKRCFWIREGDLVVSNVFAWEGAAAVADREHDLLIGSHRFMTWTPTAADVSTAYLRHFLTSDAGIRLMAAASPGSAGRNRTLSVSNFISITVPLPTLRVQQRIADHLDAIEVISARASSNSVGRKAAYHDLVNHLEQRSAMSVGTTPLRDVVTLRRTAVNVAPDHRYQMAGLLNRGRGMFRRPAINGNETKYTTLYLAEAGQLIYSKLFGWEGSIAIVPDDMDGCYVSSEFPTFDIDCDAVDPVYLGHMLGWEGVVNQLASSTTGLGQRRQRVNIPDFLRVEIPIPPLGEQQRIGVALDMARRAVELSDAQKSISNALLPAARNEVFNAML